VYSVADTTDTINSTLVELQLKGRRERRIRAAAVGVEMHLRCASFAIYTPALPRVANRNINSKRKTWLCADTFQLDPPRGRVLV
jgi:hypothetical protein